MDSHEHIGKKLKDFIKDSGISQAELAHELKQSQQQVSYMLQKNDLPVYFIKDVCEVIKKPFYNVILSDEELAEIKKVHPNLKELIDELEEISNKKDALEMLKAVIREYKHNM